MCSPEEDVKIFIPDEEDALDSAFSEGERSAAEYVAHRKNGNLEKTRELGELLAQTLVGDSQRLEAEPFYHQKLVLLSFLAEDELEAGLPDLLLQKSAVAAMNRRLEELSPEIHAIVVDSTAFTMYILNDRQGEGESEGQVLARLCDRDDDEALIRRGDALTEEYRLLFREIIESYVFK